MARHQSGVSRSSTSFFGEDEAKSFKDEFVSVEHIYLVTAKNTPSSRLFTKCRWTGKYVCPFRIREERVTSKNEESYRALEKYGRSLVELARMESDRL